MSNDEFWKLKLMAFLHDPPDKCFDIGKHEESAASFMVGAGFADVDQRTEYLKKIKSADHFASAADRFAFPRGKCSTVFTGKEGTTFVHPMASNSYIVPDSINLQEQHGHLHEILKDAVGSISIEDPQNCFFLYWRRWLENSVSSNKSNGTYLAFAPADSRIPDHSIWVHNAVTSAVAGCIDGDKVDASMLLFQLGPVQDFIAQARSTRDLWSGSYLLSWLMAHAMKSITDEIGPDVIIFPNLRGNGIFDALHRNTFYQAEFKHGDVEPQTLWQRMLQEKENGGKHRAARWLTTPTLPNRFLALVPAGRTEELAGLAERAIKDELNQIGTTIWNWIAQEANNAGCENIDSWHDRWQQQIEAFPQITWAVQPWLKREDCLRAFEELPVNKFSTEGETAPLERLQDMLGLGEIWLPQEDRDSRYYSDDTKTILHNPGILWSAHYALVDAKLASRRNTRDFSAWGNPCSKPKTKDSQTSKSTVKDSLSGKEEIIGDEKFWAYLQKEHNAIFRTKSHFYGAMNMIKRLWCREDNVDYLRKKLGLSKDEYKAALKFESVEDVAGERGYVAVIAMDGDEMGKWVSGQLMPKFLNQLSANAQDYLKPYCPEDMRRLLSPSYHLQFSEALANFSTWLAEPIVDAFDGQLIYSGGDDVLAMVPADQATACALALRAVFRGEQPENTFKLHLHVEQSGFVLESAGYPLMVPGAKTDASIGIAIGHKNAPLQMLVKEAQAAEKMAKSKYDRSAVAFSVYKRSGEILRWGCNWASAALPLMRLLTELGNGKKISGRFPYALAQLLHPYQLDDHDMAVSPSDMLTIVGCELEHVIKQQGSDLRREEHSRLADLCTRWLKETATNLEDFVMPFLTETFINRARGED